MTRLTGALPVELPSRFELGLERRAPTLSPMQRRLSATISVECFKAALLLVLQAEGDERKLLIHELKIMVQRSLEPLRGFCQPLLAFEALFKKEHLRIGRLMRQPVQLF